MKAKNIILLIIVLIISIPLAVGSFIFYQAYQKIQEENALYQKNINAVLEKTTQGEKKLEGFFQKAESLHLDIGSLQDAYSQFKSAEAKLHTFSTPKGMESKTAKIDKMLNDFVSISHVSASSFSNKYLSLTALKEKWKDAGQLLADIEKKNR